MIAHDFGRTRNMGRKAYLHQTEELEQKHQQWFWGMCAMPLHSLELCATLLDTLSLLCPDS